MALLHCGYLACSKEAQDSDPGKTMRAGFVDFQKLFDLYKAVLFRSALLHCFGSLENIECTSKIVMGHGDLWHPRVCFAPSPSLVKVKDSFTLNSSLCFSVRSDLQVVPSNCNREAVLALIVKQLKSLGVPFVHDIMYAAETLGEVHGISRKQQVGASQIIRSGTRSGTTPVPYPCSIPV